MIGLLDTKDESSKRKLYSILKELKPGTYVYKLKLNRPVRSLSANRYYHMIWNIYATYTGHYVDELKAEFYEKIGFYNLFTDNRGKITKRFKSTADCNTLEMASIINQQLEWGRNEFPEVKIPRQEDTTYLQWLQVENDYNKAFSGF